MLFGFIVTLKAQDAMSEKPSKTTTQQNQSVDDGLALDPKLSAEEIEQLKVGKLQCAPANAEAIPDDPRDIKKPDVVPAPWKAEPVSENDREIALPTQSSQVNQTSPQVQVETQPEPAKSDNSAKKRYPSGPSTQPLPPTSEKSVNKRSMQGPSTQPVPKPDGK